MTVFFLVAVMLWQEEGDTFNRRHTMSPASSGEVCAATADMLRQQWQTEHPMATILIECLPVIQGRKT